DLLRLGLGLGQSRQKHRRQDGNDGDDHEQFNQSKRGNVFLNPASQTGGGFHNAIWMSTIQPGNFRGVGDRRNGVSAPILDKPPVGIEIQRQTEPLGHFRQTQNRLRTDREIYVSHRRATGADTVEKIIFQRIYSFRRQRSGKFFGIHLVGENPLLLQ